MRLDPICPAFSNTVSTGGSHSSLHVCVCVCWCVNAAASRQHRSVPHCASLIVSNRLLSLRRAGTGGVAAARIQRAACFQIKNSWPSHESQGIPRVRETQLLCFSFGLCPVSSLRRRDVPGSNRLNPALCRPISFIFARYIKSSIKKKQKSISAVCRLR